MLSIPVPTDVLTEFYMWGALLVTEGKGKVADRSREV
jgi:hypothetical protein